jgi:hypothetical protein
MTLCKNCFQKQFWTSGRAQTRKPALSLSCVFWLGHFQGPKLLLKAFLHTILYKYYYKNNFLAFCLKKMGLKKMDFPLYFKNVI